MIEIPIYALYGEQDGAGSQDWQSWMHWETIPSRSRLYRYNIAPHRHEHFHQILYLKAGSARLTIDEIAADLAPPAIVSVPALAVHGYSFSEDVEGYVLTLFARDVQTLLREDAAIAANLMRPTILQGPAIGPAAEMLDSDIAGLIAEAGRTAPGQITALKARTTLLLVTLHRLDLHSSRPVETGDDRAHHHARSFQALVDADYRNTRAVGYYAQALGITPAHLNRICRHVFGTSALAVIERRIIIEAKRYLQFSGLSIKEIGIILGYPDPAYFSRFFTRVTGTTPTVFRTNALRSATTLPAHKIDGSN